jgi:6-phosphogluconolactonase (cycloisomerase 2 family)
MWNGMLTDCRNITTPPGAGPRHGAFWSPPTGTDKFYYVVHELTQKIGVYRVRYQNTGCPTFTLQQELTGFPNNEPATAGSKPAEVRVKGNYVYMTNRNDNNSSPDDSIDSVTQYSIGSDGLLTFTAVSSSHGLFPRTFAINRAGTLAAIGDQTSSNVAIVRRDTSTGALGALVANLQVGPQGTFDGLDGLSSVVWAE